MNLKKITKGLLVFLGIFFLALDVKASEFNIKSVQYKDYTYTNNGKVYQFNLFYDDDSKLPLFQEHGNQNFIDGEGYSKEVRMFNWDGVVNNALYLTTNGEAVSDSNAELRAAMQIYIYEDFARRNKDNLQFNFDVSKYHEMANKLLEDGKKMTKEKTLYYTVKQDKWTNIDKELRVSYDEMRFEDVFSLYPNMIGEQTESGFKVRV